MTRLLQKVLWLGWVLGIVLGQVPFELQVSTQGLDANQIAVGDEQNTPFRYIQDAVDRGLLLGCGPSVPCVVRIGAGEYIEDVTLISGVHLQGQLQTIVLGTLTWMPEVGDNLGFADINEVLSLSFLTVTAFTLDATSKSDPYTTSLSFTSCTIQTNLTLSTRVSGTVDSLVLFGTTVDAVWSTSGIGSVSVQSSRVESKTNFLSEILSCSVSFLADLSVQASSSPLNDLSTCAFSRLVNGSWEVFQGAGESSAMDFTTVLIQQNLDAINNSQPLWLAPRLAIAVYVGHDAAPVTFMTTGVTTISAPLLHPFAVFGSGADGDVTLDSGSNTALTTDMFYNSLTMQTNAVLRTAGFRIFVRNTLTLNGNATICNNGNPGVSGQTGTTNIAQAGAATSTGTLGGGVAGGNGAAALAIGTNGGASTVSLGAGGGAGGAGGGAAAGTGGTATAPTAANGGSTVFREVASLLRGRDLGSNVITGGAGGGGGGGTTLLCTGRGGGGGGGGGVLLVSAGKITGTGYIQANGGAGAIGGDNSGCVIPGSGAGGGGGGGGGGVTGVLYAVLALDASHITASGGSPGTQGAGGGGAAGTAGSSGTVVLLGN